MKMENRPKQAAPAGAADIAGLREYADQAFSRAAGAPLVGGNDVRLLLDAAENYPAWLDARIAQMEASDFYMGTIIYSYIWTNEYYYLISIPLSSCIMCEFYSYRGEKVEWTQDKINDFQKNGKKTGIVWQRWS